MKTQEAIEPLPFFDYFWSVVAIALVGLADALYLAVAHYRNYTDMGYKSFCAVSKSINCDTVSQSSFTKFLDVPVPSLTYQTQLATTLHVRPVLENR